MRFTQKLKWWPQAYIRHYARMSGAEPSQLQNRCMATKATSGAEPSQLQNRCMATKAISGDESNIEQPNGAELRNYVRGIFSTAIKSVLPHRMVTETLQLQGNKLKVKGREYELDHNVHVVAFGKAVIGMVHSANDVLGEHIVDGVASVPCNIQQTFIQAGKGDLLPNDGSKVVIHEGARNNIPDEAAHEAATAIHKLAMRLKQDDILLVLVSGGGSALLPSPEPPITLADMAATTKLLASAGATIQELNTARKQLEQLKGGGLARAAYPAKVLTLILSDVIDSPLDMIASGPTVEDPSTPLQCLGLLDQFKLQEKVPQTVIDLLSHKLENVSSTKTSHTDFSHVHNVLVGTNEIAVNAAVSRAIDLGFLPFVLSTSLSGDATKTGIMFAKLAHYLCLILTNNMKSNKILCQLELELCQMGVEKGKMNQLVDICHKAGTYGKGVCVISGGETTVNVKGQGKGGRNQELALAAAVELDQCLSQSSLLKHYGIELLSGGTDGQDGPTEAAGAMADPYLVKRAMTQGLLPQIYLDNNDTYTFYSTAGGGRDLVVTGLTGTNVMDIQILLIDSLHSVDAMGSF